MNTNEAAYIAGLFDSQGTVEYVKRKQHKKGKKKAYNYWSIRCEMSMPDREVMAWVHETIGCGTLNKRDTKKTWRWRCSYREALTFVKIIWPYAIIKLHKIEQIIDHYEPRAQELGDNVVDLETERQVRRIWP